MLKETIMEFIEDDCHRLAAAISYYTVFALPPLLILILVLVGTLFDAEAARERLQAQVAELLGNDAADQIGTMIEQASRPDFGGPLTAAIGVGLLLFGATGAFVQLQIALNKAWDVHPDPNRGGAKNFILKRLLSLSMIVGIAFLMLVSLLASAIIGAFGDVIAGLLPNLLSGPLLQGIDIGLSLAVATVLFAAIFKFMPDAQVHWRTVWLGAFVTAVLFVAGKFALGLWFGRSDPGEAYGAAGSLALILVWIYYSAMILLLGAEFTQVWARRRGIDIKPAAGAVVETAQTDEKETERTGP